MKKKIDPEKLRDMVRSILPSRHRKPARIEKAARKRAYRRTIREKVRVEDAEETSFDLTRDVYVRDLVNARRSDKLNHFMRWCEAKTKHMTDREALQYVRALLPQDVIGNHAYFHWEIHVKYRRRPQRRRHRPRKSDREIAIERLRRALAIDPTLQGRLNRMIKATGPGPHRLLLGVHDIEAFIAEAGWPERDIMSRLIAEIENGGREAALRLWSAAAKPPLSLRRRQPPPESKRRLCRRSPNSATGVRVGVRDTGDDGSRDQQVDELGRNSAEIAGGRDRTPGERSSRVSSSGRSWSRGASTQRRPS